KTDLQNRFDFRCHEHLCTYSCECSSIEVVNYTKYLGLIIDQHLKWDSHVGYLNGKLRKINYSLYHMREFVRQDQLKQVYIAWFESTLRYGIIHYGGTYTTVLQSVIVSQRHAVRNVYQVRKIDRVDDLVSYKFDYKLLGLLLHEEGGKRCNVYS
ncbi:hypothetical protein J6590_091413, partial [Homalodisca vitripennis]